MGMGRSTRGLAGACAAGSLLLLGCSQRATDVRTEVPLEFAATTSYLIDAADNSAGQPYRFSVTTEVSAGDGQSEHVASATGAFDGELTQVRVDLGTMVDTSARPLPPGVDRDDLFVEAVAGPDTVYARAPVLHLALAEGPPPGTPPAAVELVQALAEGWVSVDLAALDDAEPGRAAGALAGDRTDPTVYLDLIHATDAVEELAPDEIDGVPVRGLAGDVPLYDLLALHGGAPAGGPGGEPGPLADVTVPIEVWVDGDGLIRRVRITTDTGEITAALVDAGALPGDAAGTGGVVITDTLDLRDHGDDTIDVEVPSGAVDMTDAFREVLLSVDQVPAGLDGVEGDLAALERMYGELDGMYAELDGMYAEMDAGLAELDDMYAELDDTGEPPYPDLDTDLAELERELAELEEAYDELGPLPEVPEMPELPPIPEMPEMPEIPDDPTVPGG